MTFDSFEFLLFGLVFFLLWPLFRRKSQLRWGYIVVASFIFYGYWDWRFLFLILISGLVDFFCGLGMLNKPAYRKYFLIASLVANLGLLSIFKYSEFFAGILENLFASFYLNVSLKDNIPEFFLILPVGISFYTFQSLSYTIDIYRGRLNPTKNILHFFSYLSMFPQLVAGPIVRAKDLLKQLESYSIPNSLQKWNGFKLICYGLFQKMVLADNLAFFVDSAFEGKSVFDGSLYWWAVMIAFSFQIYCDFSGYTLIARGLAKYMGYHFKRNFNHPYLSSSLKEFWSRWHISLSTWFRDYVYIPLGGSKSGVLKMFWAILITMLLSGLWHGANYTFLVWALVHSFFLISEKLISMFTRFRLNNNLSIPIVFVLATIAWVYFRADNTVQANEIVQKLLIFNSLDLAFFREYFDNMFFLLLAIFLECCFFLKSRYSNIRVAIRKHHWDLLFVSLSILCIMFLRGPGKQFIYFQF